MPNSQLRLEEMHRTLGIAYGGNSIYQLPNSVYVHVYKNTIACSSFKLSMALAFFSFDVGLVELPDNSAIDIMPFVFCGEDLRICGASFGSHTAHYHHYQWVTEPKIAWDWGEDVWATRLVQCMEMSGTSTDVRIIPAFRWTSRGYTSQINTLFPHVMSVKATPFHGMTDILLMGPESVGVVRERLVVSIELGINKVATTPITVGRDLKMWPEKVGELLASMYMFGTLKHSNSISWTTFGILAIHPTGFLILKMILNGDGCCVHLVHPQAWFCD